MNFSKIKRTRGSTLGVSMSRAVLGSLCGACAFLAGPMTAQEFAVSPDITAVLANVTVADEAVVNDDLNTVTPVDLGPLSPAAEVVAYHLEGSEAYFALATATVLAGGLTADPRDVVVWDGNDYDLFFEGAAAGVPGGVRIDAMTLASGTLLLSFDVTVVLDGELIADEDLAKFGGSFALTFDASSEGISPHLDLDGASQLPDGRLALSFDGSGTVDGVAFDDEDVVTFDSGAGWELLYDGSALDSSWRPADLDALFVSAGPPPPMNVVFADGFESGNTSAWSAIVP